MSSILPTVLGQGPDQALAWSNGIEDERLRSGALTYILEGVSKREPQEAAEMLVRLDDSEAALRAADDVAGAMARTDLDQAIVWSEGLEPGLRAEAVEGVISLYASRDAEAASRWMESLSTDTDLDPAIRRFAWHSQASTPSLPPTGFPVFKTKALTTKCTTAWWGW